MTQRGGCPRRAPGGENEKTARSTLLEDGSPSGAEDRAGGAEPSRREALKILLAGALASGALGRGAGAMASEAAGATDVLVGDLSEIPAGSAAEARFHGLPVLVIHLDEGPVVLSAICTHEGCMVTWERGMKQIVCPCHDGRYSGEGEVLGGPPPAPLLSFPVRVEDGKVYVVE